MISRRLAAPQASRSPLPAVKLTQARRCAPRTRAAWGRRGACPRGEGVALTLALAPTLIFAVALTAALAVAQVRGLISKTITAPLLRMIRSWPTNAEGTSATTRQPHRRIHQALPMREGASAEAGALLISNLQPVLRRALGSRSIRQVECGFLTALPAALAQSFHSDTSPPSLRGECKANALTVHPHPIWLPHTHTHTYTSRMNPIR